MGVARHSPSGQEPRAVIEPPGLQRDGASMIVNLPDHPLMRSTYRSGPTGRRADRRHRGWLASLWDGGAAGACAVTSLCARSACQATPTLALSAPRRWRWPRSSTTPGPTSLTSLHLFKMGYKAAIGRRHFHQPRVSRGPRDLADQLRRHRAHRRTGDLRPDHPGGPSPGSPGDRRLRCGRSGR